MNKARILIVEDEAVVALEVKDTLERLGYSVVGTANSGEKAICIAQDKIPDIILMDIRLKGEMDGVEAAEQIKNKIDIPIIFLTAYAEDDKIDRAKLTLPFGYLLKPIQDRDLKVAIELAIYVSKANNERNQAQKELEKAHEELEQKIEERTKELQHEIDERIQIEEDLKTARKEAELANESKSDFLSNISHEIRTPMHQVLSFSRFGIEKIKDVKREKLLHYFSRINTISKNLQLLLNDLLDLSKLESGKMDYSMRDHDLVAMVKSVMVEFDSIIKDKNVSIITHIPDTKIHAKCDEHRINQVIRNLISNAVKFTTKNEKITIAIQSDEICIEDNEKVPAVLINVSDRGVGIPNNELEVVFDKFIQSSKTKTGSGGTGLGLAICKEIILKHKGEIWAENNTVGGAIFHIKLPVQQ